MMDTVNARILVRRDTTENWRRNLTFIPMRGEIIVYTDGGQTVDDLHNPVNVPTIKVGDGTTYLVDLPFVGADLRYQLLNEIRLHAENADVHVTPAEKAFWNNKLNYTTSGEVLILNRN